MCGRFTLGRHDREELARELGVEVERLPEVRARYNIAPTDSHLLVRQKYEEREGLPATWGLVNAWAEGPVKRLINARAESADRSPAFRESFLTRRCIVPADGFFEWVGPKEARQPLWFHREDGGLILFAGLYASWQPRPGEWERTFTILTTRPNGVVEAYHDRMPVILAKEAVDDWLNPNEPNPKALKRLLVPAADDLLQVRRVSRAVNLVANDYPELLEPVA